MNNMEQINGKGHSWIKVAVPALIVFISLGAIWYFKSQAPKSPDAGDETGEIAVKGDDWSFSLAKAAFAGVSESTAEVKPALAYNRPKMSELENLASFEKAGIKLSAEQAEGLEESGFFLAANDIIKDQSGFQDQDDFTDTYKALDGNPNKFFREGKDAVFITSDLALHLYHILIGRSFQRLEETKFQPGLRAMTKALFEDSARKYGSVSDPDLKDSYKRLSAFYLIPLVVLDAGSASSGRELKPEDFETFAQYLDAQSRQASENSDQPLAFVLSEANYGGLALDQEIYDLARQELLLIQEAKGIAPSPFFTPLRPEFLNDYSQFVPRSHYTKNDVLKSYFIAMMWYGRMGFSLNSPDLTRDALLMTGQINNVKAGDGQLSRMWSEMMEVIDFFVGEVDDLTAYQYTDIIRKVYGESVNEGQFVDRALLEKFQKTAVKDLPPPRILSEAIEMPDFDAQTKEELLLNTMQFRFMGQRFTPDAYIINKLTQGDEAPDPETGQKLPTMPTALMPIRVIAPENVVVAGYLDEWIMDPARIAAQGRESDKVIAKVLGQLDREFASYNPSVWTKNIYWSWLDCFRPLLSGYGQGYPLFMQGDDWQKKNLGTVLGSYTELKHDTLLYAKQSYAELGGGGPDPAELPPVVKGYVEPDLVFWNRVINLAKTTKDGLGARQAMPAEFKGRYDTFVTSAEFFRQLVRQQLSDQAISEDDFEKLRTISNELSQITAPLPGQELTDKEKRAGIIADIHTDVPHGEILYEATGKPLIIYAAIKDANGARLTRGAVFEHYELIDKIDGRLTDEAWQERAYLGEGELPARDKWTGEIVRE